MEEPAHSPADAVPRCGACGGEPEGAILMTCLHVLCRNCEPTPTAGSTKTSGGQEILKYICPVCSPTLTSHAKTSLNGTTSPITSGIASQPCVSIEEVRRRGEDDSTESSHENDSDNDDDEDDDDEGGCGGEGGSSSSSSSSLIFSCPQHPHRDSERFCLSCRTLACSKCLTSFHRRCLPQNLVTCAEARVAQRSQLNSLHSKLAQRVMEHQGDFERDKSRLESLEKHRSTLVSQITAVRKALVDSLLEKEQQLIKEVESAIGKEKGKVEGRAEVSRRSARAAEAQLSVLEAVMSVQGEAEILSLLPSLHERLNAVPSNHAQKDTSLNLVFNVNTDLYDAVHKSDLGQIARANQSNKEDKRGKNGRSDLSLTLMTSFHARTREDTVDPLLTDLLLLPTGDVILTDRDNKCVKKFNSTGRLLTRVPIAEVPSRLALVSHGRAAVSVLHRKRLFFLSLLGTVRILSSVKVAKPYCFLAAAGQGLGQGQGQGECHLLAATHQCDVVDLISESGKLLRRVFAYGKGERVSLSRPLYLHVPADAASAAALVVDSGRRALFGLTSDGQTAFTFKVKDADEKGLECPLGVGTVGGLILLADRDKNRVLLLGRAGGFVREVLGEGEGLHKPCAVYTGMKGRVGLTQVDGWVKVYRVD